MPETLVFSRSLYRPDAVSAAAEAYGSVARIEVAIEGSSIVATIHDADPEVPAEELADSFCNHALHETILRHREELGGLA